MTRSVLITGASSGFGRNAALDLAREGWRVFAGMRDPARGRALAEEADALDGSIEPVAIDVTDAASVAAAAGHVHAAAGGAIDALLNNAGYAVMGAFEDLPDDECRRQMETNFFGALAVTRAVLPAMRERRAGRIAIVTSNACNSPHPMLTMYAASKWALEGWAEGLAMEVAPFGIEVAVVQPGAHRTPFAEHVRPVVPEGSAYEPWLAAATPGIANLDRWGRDPERARQAIRDTVAAPAPPFRTALGEDTVAFAALKAGMPYEVRAAALRAIVGMPGPNAFVQDAPVAAPPTPLAAQVAQALARDPRLVEQVLALLAPGETARG